MGQFVVVEQLHQKLATGVPMQLVDVRSASEYGIGHLPGSVNIPLEQIESRLDDLANCPLVLICKTGKRAQMAAGLLGPCRKDITVLDGGAEAWTVAGHSLVRNLATRWSMERQVRLGAGVMVLAGVLLALTTNVHWMYLSALAGLGLSLAGLTDFCPMALVLGKMPWNGPRGCDGPIVDTKSSNCCT